MCVRALYLLISLLSTAVSGNPSLVGNCLLATPSVNSESGTNQVPGNEGVPLYTLSVQPTLTNDNRGTPVYKVKLSSFQNQSVFRDAYVSVEVTRGEDCGPGEFEFDPRDFSRQIQRGNGCPTLVSTRRKSAMYELPTLLWRPPKCGCVQIRALVMDGVRTYGERAIVSTGPLVQQACVHSPKTRTPHTEALCQVMDRHSAASILTHGAFLQRRNLNMDLMDRFGLEMALELRRSDIRLCCSKTDKSSRTHCFQKVQRRRIDRFCADGYPDIPFIAPRKTHMKKMETQCCPVLGPRRYPCFTENDTTASGADFSPLDFSLDETNPVNDLALFAQDSAEVLPNLMTVTFGPHSPSKVSSSPESQDHEDDVEEESEENDLVQPSDVHGSEEDDDIDDDDVEVSEEIDEDEERNDDDDERSLEFTKKGAKFGGDELPLSPGIPQRKGLAKAVPQTTPLKSRPEKEPEHKKRVKPTTPSVARVSSARPTSGTLQSEVGVPSLTDAALKREQEEGLADKKNSSTYNR